MLRFSGCRDTCFRNKNSFIFTQDADKIETKIQELPASYLTPGPKIVSNTLMHGRRNFNDTNP